MSSDMNNNTDQMDVDLSPVDPPDHQMVSEPSVDSANVPILEDLIKPIRSLIIDSSTTNPIHPDHVLVHLETLILNANALIQTNAQSYTNLVIPCLLDILKLTTPCTDDSSSCHKLRNECLRQVCRSGIMEYSEPHVDSIVIVLLNVIKLDNDSTTKLALRVFNEIVKTFRTICDSHVLALHEYVLNQFLSIPQSIALNFDNHIPLSTVNLSIDPTNQALSSPKSSLNATTQSTNVQHDKEDPSLFVRYTHLNECAPVAMLLLPTPRSANYDSSIAQQMVSAIMAAVLAQPKAQADEQEQNHTKPGGLLSNAPVLGMSPKLLGCEKLYADLLSLQSRSIGLLIYATRVNSMIPLLADMPRALFQVACNCPTSNSTLRRELVQVFRHIATSGVRPLLINHLPLLLVEHAFTGGPSPVADLIRPLWMTPLADVVVAEKNKLSLPLLEQCMEVFMRGIHDTSMSLQIHASLLRALIYLLDALRMFVDDNPGCVNQVENILLRVLRCITAKLIAVNSRLHEFRVMNKIILSPDLILEYPSNPSQANDEAMDIDKVVTDEKQLTLPEAGVSSTVDEARISELPEKMDCQPKSILKVSASLLDTADAIDIEASRPLQARINPTQIWATCESQLDGPLMTPASFREQELRTERDLARQFNKVLLGHIRLLLDTLRLVSSSLTLADDPTLATLAHQGSVPPAIPLSSKLYRARNHEEVELFRVLLRAAMQSFEYYWMDIPTNNMGNGNDIIFSRMGPHSKEEKEIIDAFCLVFVYIDPPLFQEVIGTQVEGMIDVMAHDTALLAFPQNFMGIEVTATRFLRIVLPTLIAKLPELGGEDTFMAAVLFRVFKLAFSALSHFPETNALVFRPFLLPLVTQCLEQSVTSLNPIQYYTMLRSLFRSMFSSKAEVLISDMATLAPTVFSDLNKRLSEAKTVALREMLVELIISFPLRLQDLVPYLEHLMPPLVMSLELGPELVLPGLRMIETVFDSLTQEFLEPLLVPVYGKLMQALYRHLQPLPYDQNMAHSAMRILGRLGGRNRLRLHWSSDMHPLLDGKAVVIPLIQIVGQEAGSNAVHFGKSFDLGITTLQVLDLLDHFDPKLDIVKSQIFSYLQYVINEANLDVDQRVLEGVFKCAAHNVPEARDYLSHLSQEFRTHELVYRYVDVLAGSIVSPDCTSRRLVQELIKELFAGVGQEATLASAKATDDNIANETDYQELSKPMYSVFHLLAVKLCTCCFSNGWFCQSGGLCGIETLVQLPVPTKWLMTLELDLVRALLFLLKSPEASHADNAQILDTLHQLIKVCNRPEIGDTEIEERFAGLITLLVSELASVSAQSREAVQAALQLLADLRATEVTELLVPAREQMLTPIYSKPLRSLPLVVQIGHISAITYCLTLRPPLLDFNDQLMSLVSETLALADAEDQAILSEVAGSSLGMSPSHVLVRLRVVCIQLLSAVMACNDFHNQNVTAKRNRITSIFFKSLHNQSADVVEAGFKAMNQLLIALNKKIHKDLLQTGLRPILSTLADASKLTVAALHALSRLMELLSSNFKVELGQKLLEHLLSKIVPDRLEIMSGGNLDDLDDFKLIMAILSVFQHLPAKAQIYLQPLVKAVLSMETIMRRTNSSPFRAPLSAFLARYPTETFEYFLSMIETTPQALSLFVGVLSTQEGSTMREKFVDYIHHTLPENYIITLPLVQVISALIRADHKVLLPDILDRLPELDRKDAHLFSPFQEDLVELYIYFLNRSSSCIFTIEKLSPWIYHAPHAYHYTRVLSQFHNIALAMEWRQVDELLERTLSQDAPDCSIILHHVIIPACQACFVRYKSLVLTGLNSELIAPQPFDKPVISPIRLEQIKSLSLTNLPDLVIIEWIQLYICVILYAPDQFAPIWNNILETVLGLIHHDDVTVKATVYTMVAILGVTYVNVPADIISQTFAYLIRESKPEARSLAIQGLQILLPVLSQQLEDYPQSMVNIIIKAFAGDVPGNHGSLLHLCAFLVRNRDTFFDLRGELYESIIKSVLRLYHILSQGGGSEPRLAGVGLLCTLIEWGKKERKLISESTDPKEGNEIEVDIDESQSQLSQNSSSDKLSHQMRDELMNMIARYSCYIDLPDIPPASRPISIPTAADGSARSAPSPNDQRNVIQALEDAVAAPSHWIETVPSNRAHSLMRDFLELWPDNPLRLSLLEKALVQAPIRKESFATIARSIEILAIDLERPRSLERIAETYRLISRVFQADNVAWFSGVLYPYFVALLQQTALEGSTLTSILDIIQSRLERLENAHHLPITISVLELLERRDPLVITPNLLTLLIKHILHLSTAHVTPGERTVEGDICLKQCWMLVAKQMNAISLEQRRSLAQNSIILLVQKSGNEHICRFFLDLVKIWVDAETPLPTPRELAQVLLAMICFERFEASTLFSDYLRVCGLLLDKRNEISGRLEPVYLRGLRVQNPEIRAIYIKLADDSLPRTIMSRFEYAFGIQNWEQYADRYYIPQVIDLVLGALSIPPQVLAMLRVLPHQKPENAHHIWRQLFSSVWSCLPVRDRTVIQQFIIAWLTRDFHHRQTHLIPNVVYTILETITQCRPIPRLAPQVIKYLGKTFNAWHAASEYLSMTHSMYGVSKEEERVRDLTLDGLGELLHDLNETDLVTGLWRRRCQYPETNAALSYEQVGLWEHAQRMYEQAQHKGRTGTLGFQESEFILWEEQWIRCSQKLQQWDILDAVATQEQRKDLTLESAWRLGDWTSIESRQAIDDVLLSATDSTRNKVFRAFIALNKLAEQSELDNEKSYVEFKSTCDEGVQMALSSWHQLPVAVSDSHIPFLALFQQFVELSEAFKMYRSLADTNANNYVDKAAEQKNQLSAWRERLPNKWDDMDVWSDLVAWRQHVFGAINKTFFPIHAQLGAQTVQVHPSAYRGCHETAWIINRFANVARFHCLVNVCTQYLPKIYALPNIEIQEAFLKLREQAKCYLQNPNEYRAGLDIINHTNLVYFSNEQKAEFYSLKGRFLALLGSMREADKAFGNAVQANAAIAKVWATWGEHMERHLKISEGEGAQKGYDKEALSCYLTTISYSKCGRARQYVAKALWLLANQNKEMLPLTVVLEEHKSNNALWYWVSFIPQLLTMLIDPHQTQHANHILLKIASAFPQALYFPLRTLLDEVQTSSDVFQLTTVQTVMTQIKTNAPLLTLSMEAMGDQLIAHSKPLPKEDLYRLVVACLNEMVDYMCTQVTIKESEIDSHPSTSPLPIARSLQKLAVHLQGSESLRQYYSQFKSDFIDGPPEPMVVIDRFRIWRDELQAELDRVKVPELLPQYLIEFQYHKLDDVAIPGQYLQLVESNQSFIKLARFGPEIQRLRINGNCHRYVQAIGHNGSAHSFLIQQPVPSMFRREERVMQILAHFNDLLDHSRESRKRNIQFQCPKIIPISANVRLLTHDPDSISLEQIWTAHCKKLGVPADHAIMMYMTQLQNRKQADSATKIELLEEIRRQFAPTELLESYLYKQTRSYTEMWMLRKQFTTHMAATCFISYALAIALRYPQSIHVSKRTGHVWMSESYMSLIDLRSCSYEPVPFRLTPTIQHMITPHGLDGPFTASILAIAKGLSVDGSHKSVVADILRCIVRDDVVEFAMKSQALLSDSTGEHLRQVVLNNVHDILTRISTLVEDCHGHVNLVPEKVQPTSRHLLELIGRATNPQNLADMSITWMPYL